MTTTEEIELEIRRKARNDAEVKRGLEKEALKVQEYWRSVSPVDSGEYAASIEVKARPDVEGWPAKKIIATDDKAEYIEYGTGPAVKHHKRRQGGWSPAFAPRAKTAAHFFGDESPA